MKNSLTFLIGRILSAVFPVLIVGIFSGLGCQKKSPPKGPSGTLTESESSDLPAPKKKDEKSEDTAVDINNQPVVKTFSDEGITLQSDPTADPQNPSAVLSSYSNSQILFILEQLGNAFPSFKDLPRELQIVKIKFSPNYFRLNIKNIESPVAGKAPNQGSVIEIPVSATTAEIVQFLKLRKEIMYFPNLLGKFSVGFLESTLETVTVVQLQQVVDNFKTLLPMINQMQEDGHITKVSLGNDFKYDLFLPVGNVADNGKSVSKILSLGSSANPDLVARLPVMISEQFKTHFQFFSSQISLALESSIVNLTDPKYGPTYSYLNGIRDYLASQMKNSGLSVLKVIDSSSTDFDLLSSTPQLTLKAGLSRQYLDMGFDLIKRINQISNDLQISVIPLTADSTALNGKPYSVDENKLETFLEMRSMVDQIISLKDLFQKKPLIKRIVLVRNVADGSPKVRMILIEEGTMVIDISASASEIVDQLML